VEQRGTDGRRTGPGGGGAATAAAAAAASSFAERLPAIVRTGNRQIGLPLLGVGAVLTVLGASLFFNKTLMRLGNLFFVAGVPMTLGPGRTAGYFFQPKKARATACLAAGLFLVFVGWPVLGILLEAFGLLNLFGNMFPLALAIVKQMPVIGPLLRGEVGGGAAAAGRFDDDRGKGSSSNSNRQRRGSYDDYYYDDRPDDGAYQDRDHRYYDEPNSFYADDREDDNVRGFY
jgi:Got1/Sft2-like family